LIGRSGVDKLLQFVIIDQTLAAHRRKTMKLTPPTKFTLLLSAVLALLGIIGTLIEIPYVTGKELWMLAAGYLLLFLGVLFKRL
jgi:hypothetical protein